MSPKNTNLTNKMSRSEKVFKNPEIPPPPTGSLTKLGQPLPSQLQSNRANVANALFKQSNLAFSMSGNWSQPQPTITIDGVPKNVISSSSDLYNPSIDRTSTTVSSSCNDVTSSSCGNGGNKNLPTSTPSSPVESPSMINESLKNQTPLIIPTEAIDDNNSNSNSGSNTIITSSSNSNKLIDSTDSSLLLMNRFTSSADSSTSSTSASSSNQIYTTAMSACDIYDSPVCSSGMKRKLSDQTLLEATIGSKQIFFPSSSSGSKGSILLQQQKQLQHLSMQQSLTSQTLQQQQPSGSYGSNNDFYPSSSTSNSSQQNKITSADGSVGSGGDTSVIHLDADSLIGSSDL